MRMFGLISLLLMGAGCLQPSSSTRRPDGGPDPDAPPVCTSPDDCDGNPCCYRRFYPTTVSITCQESPATCTSAAELDAFITRLCRNDADCISGLDPETVQFQDCCSGVLPGSSRRAQFCFNREQASQLGYRCP